MSAVDFLLDGFAREAAAEAMVWRDRSYSYGLLAEACQAWRGRLAEEDMPPGAVVSLEADFSPQAVALLLALVDRGAVVVPLSSALEGSKAEYRATAQVEVVVRLGPGDAADFARGGPPARHALYAALRERAHPGLVLFSSGSTGQAKAAVHDLVPLLAKFRAPRQRLRSVAFLLFDHIGGINTLFYTLANGGCVITVEDRRPDAVCQAVARHRAELLPTSPTFLNLLIASEAWQRHDLSSLRVITYGTEVMPQTTLRRMHELLPAVKLQQTYGLSELGILRSKSRSSDSLWVQIGGEGYQTRVVDGLLEIKAEAAILGYLNAPSPFTADGWFRTGDAVQVDGEWLRILGRGVEIINVGGEKVFPAEVEGVLLAMEGVEEALVQGEPNAITGQMVTARVRLRTGEKPSEFRARMVSHCREELARFKIPQKVVLVDTPLHSERFKLQRSAR